MDIIDIAAAKALAGGGGGGGTGALTVNVTAHYDDVEVVIDSIDKTYAQVDEAVNAGLLVNAIITYDFDGFTSVVFLNLVRHDYGSGSPTQYKFSGAAYDIQNDAVTGLTADILILEAESDPLLQSGYTYFS